MRPLEGPLLEICRSKSLGDLPLSPCRYRFALLSRLKHFAGRICRSRAGPSGLSCPPPLGPGPTSFPTLACRLSGRGHKNKTKEKFDYLPELDSDSLVNRRLPSIGSHSVSSVIFIHAEKKKFNEKDTSKLRDRALLPLSSVPPPPTRPSDARPSSREPVALPRPRDLICLRFSRRGTSSRAAVGASALSRVWAPKRHRERTSLTFILSADSCAPPNLVINGLYCVL